MSVLSPQISGYIDQSSWIRKMFEAGLELKAKYGADTVYDFSLGNPDLPPPPEVGQALREMADEMSKPFALGYMPNAGLPYAKEALAEFLTKEQGVPVTAADVVLTCGAAGAINAMLRAILSPGDEIVAPAPFFVEYRFYVENFGGVFVPAPSKDFSFDLDVAAIAAKITSRTRAVIVNSPNNPTGAIYAEADLRALAAVLKDAGERFGRPILLIADEPYRFLAYDGAEVPSLLPIYPWTVVVSSFSKSLSMAGARIGFALVNPAMPERAELVAGLTLTNRILGFVNAPAVAQHIKARALGALVDASIYAARRAAMSETLDAAGFEYAMPKGAFYFFPKAPAGDDVGFCKRLMAERVLAVPGSGFGTPGYFRLAFCVDETVIRAALPGFKAALAG